MLIIGRRGVAGYPVVVNTGIKAKIETVKTCGVDWLVYIRHKRAIIGRAAVAVRVQTADVERTVIAGLQLCCSRDTDAPRKGTVQHVGSWVIGMKPRRGPRVAKRHVVAVIPD